MYQNKVDADWIAVIGTSRNINMNTSNTKYTARKIQNPGRQAWSVEFRHPRLHESGKPGRKVRKGLGTTDANEADQYVEELNTILSDESFWTPSAREKAAKKFRPLVVEIFYQGLEPATYDHKKIREGFIPLPGQKAGYTRTLLLGVPGAGKTTLLRQLIGSHPERDRFPATSINRTTTCETEVITAPGDFDVAITFITEHEAEVEVRESLLNGVLKANGGGDDETIAREFLEHSEMRFRLKYLVGELPTESQEDDGYNNCTVEREDSEIMLSPSESDDQVRFIRFVISGLRAIAKSAHTEVKTALGDLFGKEPGFDLDEIERAAEESDEFSELVEEVMDKLRQKFAADTKGTFEKTPTGWATVWHLKTPASQRREFLTQIRPFVGIATPMWGRLLTPLVNGVRVQGPFLPTWVESQPTTKYRNVYIDTEGLGHRAKTQTEIPDQVIAWFKDVDVILLVESAENALSSAATTKVFEAVTSSGHVSKLCVVFTHWDSVKGENLGSPAAKKNHIYGGIRNVVDNQIAVTLGKESARQLGQHLHSNTFYLGMLDKADPVPARKELLRLVGKLNDSVPKPLSTLCFPEYTWDLFGFAVQEGAAEFQEMWKGYLGFKRNENFPTAPWQSVKALSRRYSEGLIGDGFWLKPIANLRAALTNALSRFLDNPASWTGEVESADAEAAIKNRIKSRVVDRVLELARDRLYKQSLPQWQEAYRFRGQGTTIDRKHTVNSIMVRRAPVPELVSDKNAREFLDEVKQLVMDSVQEVKEELAQSAKVL